jgi:hypothetical protein
MPFLFPFPYPNQTLFPHLVDCLHTEPIDLAALITQEHEKSDGHGGYRHNGGAGQQAQPGDCRWIQQVIERPACRSPESPASHYLRHFLADDSSDELLDDPRVPPQPHETQGQGESGPVLPRNKPEGNDRRYEDIGDPLNGSAMAVVQWIEQQQQKQGAENRRESPIRKSESESVHNPYISPHPCPTSPESSSFKHTPFRFKSVSNLEQKMLPYFSLLVKS